MNSFLQRALTGIVFVAVLIGSITWNYISAGWLFFILTALGSAELLRIAQAKYKPLIPIGGLLSVSLFLGIFYGNYYQLPNYTAFAPTLVIAFATFLIELYRKTSTPFENVAWTFLSAIYVALPFGLLYATGFSHDGTGAFLFNYEPILGTFMLIWANDTGAYLVGRSIGKNKLFPSISPNKTWEGTIGGIVVNLGVAFALAHFFKNYSLMIWIGASLIVSTIGSMGDLVESQFKRSFDIKDSGTLLPGHGGILDRFDAVLLASPLIYLLFKFAV